MLIISIAIQLVIFVKIIKIIGVKYKFNSIRENLMLQGELVSNYPLQIEVLDNEMKELQSSLLEARSRNLYLENILEQQQK